MSEIREALAQLLDDAERSVRHTCGMIGSDDCVCDYAQWVRLRQAEVMEAVVEAAYWSYAPAEGGGVTQASIEYLNDVGRAALAAGQAQMERDK